MTTSTTTVPRPAPEETPAPPPPVPPRAGAVFGAMVRKEARELGPVTGLVLLAVGAVLASLLLTESKMSLSQYQYGRYQTAADVLMEGSMALLAPLAGLIIGFVQFFMESRPDRFGFVMHRPVSRARLFWCKAAAGIGMLCVALGVPLLVALWWVSDPYHVPLPYSWWMALPGLADIFSGVPFYFAGMLVARRSEAHWLGSRLLTVGAPVIPAILHFLTPNFGVAVLVTLASAGFMVTIAQGAYVAGGQYRPMGRAARATLGLATLVSLLLLGGLALSLLDELLRPAYAGSGTEVTQTLLELGKDGRPILVTQAPGTGLWEATDLNGMPLPATATGKSMANLSELTMQLGQASTYREQMDRNMFHISYHYFAHAFSGDDGTTWFQAMPAMGANYLVGFSGPGRMRVGALGAQGLEAHVAAPRTPLATPIHVLGGSSSYHMVLSAGDTLYSFTRDNALEPFYKAPEPILSVGRILLSDPGKGDVAMMEVAPLLQTAHAVIILSPDAKPHEIVRFPLADSEKWLSAAGRVPATGEYVIRLSRDPANPWSEKSRALYFTADGKFEREMELPATWSAVNPRPNVVEDYLVPALVPPALMQGVLAWGNPRSVPPYTAAYVAQADRRDRSISAGASLVSGLGMLLLARWRQLRRGAVWYWTVLALLLGPAAILLLLCTSGLPVLVKCGGCGKAGRVLEIACPHCGAARMLPARNGTEIFV